MMVASIPASAQTWEQLQQEHLKNIENRGNEFSNKWGLKPESVGRFYYGYHEPFWPWPRYGGAGGIAGLKPQKSWEYEFRTYSPWDVGLLARDTAYQYSAASSDIKEIFSSGATGLNSMWGNSAPSPHSGSNTSTETSQGWFNTISSWLSGSDSDVNGTKKEKSDPAVYDSTAFESESAAPNPPRKPLTRSDVVTVDRKNLSKTSDGPKPYDPSKLDRYWANKYAGMGASDNVYNPSDEITAINNVQAEQSSIASSSAEKSAANQAKIEKLTTKLDDLRVKIGETKVRIRCLEDQKSKLQSAINEIDKRLKSVSKATQDMQSSFNQERQNIQNQISNMNQASSQEQMLLQAEKQRLQNQLSSVNRSISAERARARSYEHSSSGLFDSLGAVMTGLSVLNTFKSLSSIDSAASVASGSEEVSSSVSMSTQNVAESGTVARSVPSGGAVPSGVSNPNLGYSAADLQNMQNSYNPWGKISQYRTRGLTDGEIAANAGMRKLPAR
ncbi:MAG TPA: hypothetical protein PLI09_00610 [Candidatus Hydrogenedentes bacterium]|nr:hypothetical protein [Candidatus Hydrogenedentota bacterium]